jgi:hypothetical protein
MRYRKVMTKYDPIVSEFASSEDEAAYDAWYRARVERAMASEGPDIPHDQVMAEMDAIIAKHERK